MDCSSSGSPRPRPRKAVSMKRSLASLRCMKVRSAGSPAQGRL
jgi:hypothetical protein